MARGIWKGSMRARADAGVSVPIAWSALGRTRAGHQTALSTLLEQRLPADPWAGMLESRQGLRRRMLESVRRSRGVKTGRRRAAWFPSSPRRAACSVPAMPNSFLTLLLGLGIGLLLAMAFFLWWRAKYTRAIRLDAVQRSQAVISGKAHEQLLPHLPGFSFNPRDVRFLGSPVDFVVFDGLAEGRLTRVVFLEVKTGRGGLNGRERQLREAIQSRRVEWVEWRIDPARAS